MQSLDKMTKEQLLNLVMKKNIPGIKPNEPVSKIRAKVKRWYDTYLEESLHTRIKDFLHEYAFDPFRLQLLKQPKDPEVCVKLAHHPLVGQPFRNYLPFLGSKLEFDFAWPRVKVGIEVQGGIDMAGRRSGHVSRDGMRRDMFKLNKAQADGWVLFQFPREVCISDDWRTYGKLVLIQVLNHRLRTHI